MSSVKITELSNVLGSQINPSVDVLPIVRVGANSTDKITVEELGTLFGGGGGLEGSQYIYVAANGTDIENAAELQAAYSEAQMRLPTSTKRITIIAGPGNYNFETNPFEMSTDFIDLVSLDGNRSIIFNSSDIFGTIRIMANNIFVKGVDTLLNPFNIGNNLNLLKIENCKGGDYSFGASSFFNPQTISGTFINCEGGYYSFGGSQGATTSGTFINCVSGAASFGEFATGIFDNCKSGNDAFGASIASGTFTNCNSGINSFGITTSSGTFRNCIANDNSFGTYGGTASGNFNNCEAGDYSFGPGGGLNAIGTFTYCKAGDWSFGSGTGTFTNCEAGSNSFGAVNLANGTYNYCIAGSNSFGTNMGPSISGQLYYCRLTSGTFRTVTGAGKTVYCVDGNGNPNNQGFTPQNNL
jgi:hypothetical protein